MSTIYDRLVYIIENENMSVAAFERRIGVGRNSISTALRKKCTISHVVLQNITHHFPQYSVDWIIFGKKSPHAQLIKFSLKIRKLVEAWNEEEN